MAAELGKVARDTNRIESWIKETQSQNEGINNKIRGERGGRKNRKKNQHDTLTRIQGVARGKKSCTKLQKEYISRLDMGHLLYEREQQKIDWTNRPKNTEKKNGVSHL